MGKGISLKWMWCLLIAGVFCFQSPASADNTVTCAITGAVRCPCPASMMVKCSDGRQGFIANDEAISSAVVTYRSKDGRQKTIALQNPKSTAREFYVAESSPDVMDALKKAGITVKDGDSIDVSSIVISKTSQLFDDPNKQAIAKTPDASVSSDEMPISCSYKGYQRVVQTRETKDKSTCLSWVNCDFKSKKNVDALVYCLSSNGSCSQDALDCAKADSTGFELSDSAGEKLLCQKKSGGIIPGCQMAGVPARLSGGSQNQSNDTGSSSSTGSAE